MDQLFLLIVLLTNKQQYPDNKVHVANMGPIWGQQDKLNLNDKI